MYMRPQVMACSARQFLDEEGNDICFYCAVLTEDSAPPQRKSKVSELARTRRLRNSLSLPKLR